MIRILLGWAVWFRSCFIRVPFEELKECLEQGYEEGTTGATRIVLCKAVFFRVPSPWIRLSFVGVYVWDEG